MIMMFGDQATMPEAKVRQVMDAPPENLSEL